LLRGSQQCDRRSDAVTSPPRRRGILVDRAMIGRYHPRVSSLLIALARCRGVSTTAGAGRMPEKSMKEKLAAGELVLCMNLRLARSVDIAMVAKAGGYDALYVDMQHAPYSIETTATICAAALGIGITPLVRVPSHDPQWMSRVLDGGAQGVILPDVNTSAEAKAIVSACRFPPLGKRSVMGLGPALGYRAVPLAELNPKLNAETAVIVMLETGEGIENCEAIAAVDGIDVLLIGSGDLTTDLGIPGQVDHPRLRAAYERVAAACRTHKKVLGVVVFATTLCCKVN
jgi:2-keto-3-deoxy-L-rhamnonate aldolase RhmA